MVGILGVICIGLWGFALYQSGYLPGALSKTDSSVTPVVANSNLSCQELINQAMHVSGNYCDHLGPNQVCYGNITIKADLLPDTQKRFSKAGDIVDLQLVQSLSTAPLDLQKKEWGIAVFNIIANLPRSLPGEAVKMVVFGNTTLGNNGVEDIQSFYFFSELGQIVCDKVPFDGLMVSMPNGTGIKLKINGSELMLMGDASFKAIKNQDMEVSLFSGTASITANGQTQYFGAGQKVQVVLGGINGIEPVGPPSLPIPLSPDDSKLGCALTGLSCFGTAVPTLDPQIIQATLNAGLGTPFATGEATLIGGPTPFNPSTNIPSNPAITSTPQPPRATPVQKTPEPDNTKIPPGQEKKTPKPTSNFEVKKTPKS
jgi:hypothetical protein